MDEKLTAKERLWVALDYSAIEEAEFVLAAVANQVGAFKVGTEIAARQGWENPIEYIHRKGGEVFADTKLNDVPATVRKTAGTILENDPEFINIHVSSGTESMKALTESVSKNGQETHTKTLGVTALTSLPDHEIREIFGRNHNEAVKRMGHMAVQNGLDGLICSPREIPIIRNDEELDGLVLATPGVRPQWANKNDQQRVATPREAIGMGGDYMIVGRPITQSPLEGGPEESVARIVSEIAEA